MSNIYCPYCNQPSDFHENSLAVHKVNNGPIYICVPCNAYVGCIANTKVPKGTLGNSKVRAMRIQAHNYLDIIIEYQQKFRKLSLSEAKTYCYGWLSDSTGIPPELCHIGIMQEQQLSDVLALLSMVTAGIRNIKME